MTELTRDFQARAGAFANQFPFHLSQARHDVEEEPTGYRSGVDGVGQALEVNALLLKVADEIDRMLDAAAETVQFPIRKGVSLTETVLSLSESKALRSTTADPVFEDLLATSFLKSFRLQVEILVLRRDPCVADQHASCLILACSSFLIRHFLLDTRRGSHKSGLAFEDKFRERGRPKIVRISFSVAGALGDLCLREGPAGADNRSLSIDEKRDLSGSSDHLHAGKWIESSPLSSNREPEKL